MSTSDGAVLPDDMTALLQISNLLNTGLSAESLTALQSLIAAGASPEALVAVVKELRKEKAENDASAVS